MQICQALSSVSSITSKQKITLIILNVKFLCSRDNIDFKAGMLLFREKKHVIFQFMAAIAGIFSIN